ncbi:MAG: hypothetical protein IPM66_05445 [Acidobacteriota bacterium]|nr:MAG: hypothetical protein IPM66_05445 [Acidobacteriota bacterium]
MISTARENLSPSSKSWAFHDRRICLSRLEFGFHVPSKYALEEAIRVFQARERRFGAVPLATII